MLRDLVHVADHGLVGLRTKAGMRLQEIAWGLLGIDDLDKPVIEVKGWVTAVLRERGKILRKVEGHNIWTNTGREYLAMLMSLQVAGSPGTPFRNDRVAYIGIGTGAQAEDVGVTSLVTPVAYTTGSFLAALDVPPSFPLTPTRTTVRFHRTFLETDLTPDPGDRVDIAEMGLFTDGDPAASPAYDPGTRDTTFSSASSQAPVAYKAFTDVLPKTDATQFEVNWEIRF